MELSEGSVVMREEARMAPPLPTVTELGQEELTASTPLLVPDPTLMASVALFATDSTLEEQLPLVLNKVTAAYGDPPVLTPLGAIQSRGAAVKVRVYFESGS